MFFLLLLLLLGTSASATSSPPRWLAFGDLRGHVESCGCDPRTDLGGLNRLHYFLQLEKKANSPYLLFNLGNNLNTPPDPLKDSTIVRFIAQLQPTAALLNQRELTRRALLTRQKSYGHWLLSNHNSNQPWWRTVITTPEAVVLGYVYTPELAQEVQRFNPKLAREWQKILRQHSGKHSYLLFAGALQDLQAIVKAVPFNTIIAANTSPAAAAITHQEKLQPQRLVIKVGTRQIRMVPLAGQGVLRGGAMLNNAVEADFGKIFSTNKSKTAEPSKSLEHFFRVTQVSWLSSAYADDSAEFWQKYQRAVQKDFAEQEKKGRATLAQSSFIGAAACQGCHPRQYKVWKTSAHAHAMITLQNKKKQQDRTCVACHSVGFGAGGYVSLRLSPHLAGVQCENCHGARKAHILNPKRKTGAKTMFTCRKCHHPPHTAEFNQAAYWHKIKH